MTTLSIITPTLGRDTLTRTLKSAELQPGDEWLVISDGYIPSLSKIVKSVDNPQIRLIEGPSHHYDGNVQRNYGMERATGDYFVFIDDDDIFEPGAIDTIRRYTESVIEPLPFIFRMVNGNGEILWREPIVTRGNVGGSMFVTPNIPDKVGRWPVDMNLGYGSDILFIEQTLNLWQPVQPVWCGEVVIKCRG